MGAAVSTSARGFRGSFRHLRPPGSAAWSRLGGLRSLGSAAVFASLAAAGSPQTSLADEGCGCPQIAAVGGADPSEHVPQEITLQRLGRVMSTRAALYGGDWDQAMLALAHEIDPSGALQIWKRPAPPITDPNATFEEGGLSDYLIQGGGPGNVSLREYNEGAGHFMGDLVLTVAWINKYGETSFGLRKAAIRVARFLAGDLAAITVAKLQSYGQSPLGQAAQSGTTLGRYLSGQPSIQPPTPAAPPPVTVPQLRLAPSAPASVAAPAPTAQLPLAMPQLGLGPSAPASAKPQLPDSTARNVALAAANAATLAQDTLNDILIVAYQRPGEIFPHRPGELEVDRLDLANAALDILLEVNDKGAYQGIFTLKPGMLSDSSLVASLVRLASMRAAFGGSAAPGSKLDAVACKAFAVLVRLSDIAAPGGGASYRGGPTGTFDTGASWPGPINTLWHDFLLRDFVFNLRESDRPQAAARRSALLLAGFADGAEATRIADIMFDTVLHWADQIYGSEMDVPAAGSNVNFMLATMRDMAAYEGGPMRDTSRAAYQAELGKQFANLQQQSDSGYPYNTYWSSRGVLLLLAKWKASSPDWDPAIAAPLCAANEHVAEGGLWPEDGP